MSRRTIYALTDYKGFFGSKHFSVPYRSGMDKDLLRNCFQSHNFEIEYIQAITIFDSEAHEWAGKYVLYTSSEDPGYFYKSFIEDIVLYLEETGAIVIPSYRFLRANNNKIFMELIRRQSKYEEFKNINTRIYGSLEELFPELGTLAYPLVIKKAEGSMGKNVAMANNRRELLRETKGMTKTGGLKFALKEEIRRIIHKGYKPESKYRHKFIIQELVPGLKNDWKVYVMGDIIYIFYRPVFKKRVFKASGGGYDNYTYGLAANIPEGIFDFASDVYKWLDVPAVSLDIGYDDILKKFYLFEFQAVYFGTAGILQNYSKEYFMRVNSEWEYRENNKTIEEVYSEAVVSYINRKF